MLAIEIAKLNHYYNHTSYENIFEQLEKGMVVSYIKSEHVQIINDLQKTGNEMIALSSVNNMTDQIIQENIPFDFLVDHINSQPEICIYPNGDPSGITTSRPIPLLADVVVLKWLKS